LLIGIRLMDISYLQSRLEASMALMKAAVDPCARIAHEGMARGYRSILANYGCAEGATRDAANDSGLSASVQRDLDNATAEWANDSGAGRWRQP
jgi:hypothetical protein